MNHDHHLTRCPECHTVFRVSDAQLNAAGGKVRCGECKAVFYAPAYFTDPPVTDAKPATPPAHEASPTPVPPAEHRGRYAFVADEGDKPLDFSHSDLPVEDIELTDLAYARFGSTSEDSEHFDLAGGGEDTVPPAEDVPETGTEPAEDGDMQATLPDDPLASAASVDDFLRENGMTLETDDSEAAEESGTADAEGEESAAPPTADSPDEVDAEQDIAAETAADEVAEPEGEEALADKTDTVAENDESDASTPEGAETEAGDENEHIPYVLRESLAVAAEKPRSLGARLGLLLAVILLTVVLATQAIYFRGLDIAQRIPAARGLVSLICDRLDCKYTGPRDVRRIRLINRDIRAARDRSGVLVITATMVNEADFAQPYPIFEVVLSDLTGTSVAERRFTPEEYLGSLVKEQFLMQPGQPVQVTLEVIDPGSDAVNFEINFL